MGNAEVERSTHRSVLASKFAKPMIAHVSGPSAFPMLRPAALELLTCSFHIATRDGMLWVTAACSAYKIDKISEFLHPITALFRLASFL